MRNSDKPFDELYEDLLKQQLDPQFAKKKTREFAKWFYQKGYERAVYESKSK